MGDYTVKSTNISIDANVVTDNENIQMNDSLKEINGNKRRRENNSSLSDKQNKKLAEEKYNHEIREQQYKRLMHLLNKSKFYASYIIKKINHTTEEDYNKATKKSSKKENFVDENIPPLEKTKKKILNHDTLSYISEDVQKKLNLEKSKLFLNEKDTKIELNDIENDVEHANNNVTYISKYFNGELRNYQKEGFHWLKVLYENGINGILGDEMGLGKTVQIIALLCHLFEKKQDGPYLIIAPLSTIPNWKLEFERFAPQLPVIIFHGLKDERPGLQKKIKQKYKVSETYSTQPIVLTTFEIPLHEKSFIQSQHWRYIIIDEGHRIKNYNCLLFKILKRSKSTNRLILTGTPLQNNLVELWSLLNFLLPEIFDDLDVFKSWFDAKELRDDEGTEKFFKLEQEKHVLSSLREILQPFMLRREKADVCLEIPNKKELIVYAPLTMLQHTLYKAVLSRDIYSLGKDKEPEIIYTEDGKRPKRKCCSKYRSIVSEDSKGVEPLFSSDGTDESTDSDVWKQMKSYSKNEEDLLLWKQFADVTEHNQDFLLHLTYRNRLSMYKKIVNHPYLVYCPLNPSGLPKIDEDLVRASGKLLILDKMLPKLKSQGHKILLFSTMRTILDMLADYCTLRDYEFERLDGSISLEERKESIQKFNQDPNVFVFLITTRAGGVGLNLTGADTVIIYDSDWNPQMDIQAMARCHRIGQTRPVVIYKLCTKGTIDEAIITRGEAKRFLERMVISKITPYNMFNKSTLIELKRLLESKENEVITSENEVITPEELDKLIDRSDLYTNKKELSST